jgi:hypothetical protein
VTLHKFLSADLCTAAVIPNKASEKEWAGVIRRSRLSACRRFLQMFSSCRCSVSRGEMRHLISVCLRKRWAGQGARDIVAAGGKCCQSIEAIDQPQHIRHEDVGNGESTRQPFAS